ncbi:MAG: Lrp/AsnC family transcriptional regulator, partial [Clostridiales bacterium]|nr:Lrp/AsnC family transcriptional regulator [Clostridiales bacterium]
MQKMEMHILEILTDDARTSVGQIAAMLGLSEDAVRSAIAGLEEQRIILKYPALINWEKVDVEEVEALIEVRVTPERDHGFDAIAEQIYRFEEVRNVYLMSGGYDLLVMLKSSSLKKLALFV